MRNRMAVVCVVLGVGLAACGSSKKETASTSTISAPTTLPAAPSSSPTTVTASDQVEAIKKLVFVASDFPSGWTSKADDQTQSADDKVISQQLAHCVGTGGDTADVAKWYGDTFSTDQAQVSANVNVVKDDAAYNGDVEAIKSERLQSCVKDTFTGAFTKQLGSAPTSVDIAPLQLPAYGDVTVGVRMTVVAEGKTLYLDLVLMGKNRTEVSASLLSTGEPMDPALQKSLLDQLGARLDAA